MSRMWCVEPGLLCDDHLCGEHAELHQIVGSIRNHPHGPAIADGHARQGQLDTPLINERHGQLVTEMRRRGFSHDSPMDWDPDEYRAGIGSIDPAANRKQLRERCPFCAARMERAEVVVDG